jgi:hypothetical protein
MIRPSSSTKYRSYGDSALNSDGGFGAQSRDGTIECTVTEIRDVIRENLMMISGRFDQSSFHANADGLANTGIAA